MKIGVFIIFLAAPLLSACASAFELHDFVGKWSVIQRSSGKLYSTFTVTLSADSSGRLKGQYCFVTDYGNRIDCDPKGGDNVSGQFNPKDGTARITFDTFFGAHDGIARVSIENNKIVWSVQSDPKGGAYFGPKYTVLEKVDEDPARKGTLEIIKEKRAYLYDGPESDKASKAYLIRGDEITAINVSDDFMFWKIKYKNKKGYEIEGWIKCQDIDLCP